MPQRAELVAAHQLNVFAIPELFERMQDVNVPRGRRNAADVKMRDAVGRASRSSGEL